MKTIRFNEAGKGCGLDDLDSVQVQWWTGWLRLSTGTVVDWMIRLSTGTVVDWMT
jgi:hypothetical protein